MSDSGCILVVSDIRKSYEESGEVREVLRGVSLRAEPGETVAIVGPSGSGKSTLLSVIGSLEAPTSGSVRLGDLDVTSLTGASLSEYRAKDVGFVFQEHHLLPQLTALENVLLPTLPVGADAASRTRAAELLDRMGVSHRADAFPARMSGGERQRTAVARALVNGPRLLLCDEPTGSLDHDSGAAIVSLLLEAARERGVIVVMVTHNREQADRFDRRLELVDGLLVSSLDAPGATK